MTWAMYHRYEDGEPAEFETVSVDGARVTRRHGAALTWGEEHTSKSDSTAAATTEAVARGKELLEAGWVLSLQAATVDDVELRPLLKEAATKAFQATRDAHKGEVIDGYALYSDDDAMTIVHACTSKQSRNSDDDRWFSAEWALEVGERFLELPYRVLVERYRALDDDDDEADEYDEAAFHRHCSRAFEDCVVVLEELRRDGFFSEDLADDDVIVLFDVSDSDAGKFSFERLNPPETVAAFREYVKKWE